MANQLQQGEVLTVTTNKKVRSGQMFLLGSLALVAHVDADAGAKIAAYTSGVFELSKVKQPVTAYEIAYFNGQQVTPAAAAAAEVVDPDELDEAGEDVEAGKLKATKAAKNGPVTYKKIGYFLTSADKDSDFAKVLLSQ